MSPRFRRERAGVSEVLSALILIIVVVTAVASLGFFLSTAQKQAEASRDYLTSVQNDDLQVVYSQFYPNDPAIQWELDSISSSMLCTLSSPTPTSWYVQQDISNSGQVNLIPQQGSGSPVQVTLNSGAYNAISVGEQVSLSSGPPDILTFGSSSNNCVFETATWENITLTIRNTNTQPSSLAGVEVDTAGSQYAANTWYQVNGSGSLVSPLGASQAPLVIPARASVNIMLDSSSFGSSSIRFAKSSSLSVVLFSSMGNTFTTQYTAPTAISSVSGSTQSYEGVSRDVITLNGSQSYATGTSIQAYEWAIDVPTMTAGCNTASFSSSDDFDTIYLDGESVQYSPSLFSSSACLTGPIRATLTVTDQNGFTATASPLMLSLDPNIDPAGSISASKSSPCTISGCTVTVTVTDIFGNPMAGVVVNAVAGYGGDVTATPMGPAYTNNSGQEMFTVTFTSSGSMNFETGGLQPVQLAFP